MRTHSSAIFWAVNRILEIVRSLSKIMTQLVLKSPENTIIRLNNNKKKETIKVISQNEH